MLRKKYLYGVDGEISDILPHDCAEIEFLYDGNVDRALLKKGRFYRNGKLVPDNIPLSRYVRTNMMVKFSCHVLDRQDSESEDFYHQSQYNWYAVMCWTDNQESSEVSVSMGLVSVPCVVRSIGNRHGVMTICDDRTSEERISFLASKLYLHGKRFPASKKLNGQLSVDDQIFCDAVPCMTEESADNCKWFATCAFIGKRPRLAQPVDMYNDFRANYLSPGVTIGEQYTELENESKQDRFLQSAQQSQVDLKTQLLKIINLHTSNPRTLFTTGYGFILDFLNDEFAIMLGCFRRNVFQTILFHRKHAFLFESSLAGAKLTEIFVEGDRMRFIAVGAPPQFVTEWIAVQVSVADATSGVENT